MGKEFAFDKLSEKGRELLVSIFLHVTIKSGSDKSSNFWKNLDKNKIIQVEIKNVSVNFCPFELLFWPTF